MTTHSRRLFPIYFNPRIQRAEGRRVPFSPTAPVPTLLSLTKVLAAMKVPYKVENKHHPKLTFSLIAPFMPKNPKVEEMERYHHLVSQCITITTDENKSSFIKRVHHHMSK
ncbi:signal recognition particle subunit SRP19 [Nematocida displodere]|uniref:Signal recognition particle subunit SRP19 n=1 Tax=Nematocida displodere TaxID=1805483 RepID=A0A177ECU4_9MICR|nr:signal recognition particle subunit SRP19 [Nematocida displodere]